MQASVREMEAQEGHESQGGVEGLSEEWKPSSEGPGLGEGWAAASLRLGPAHRASLKP